MSLLTILLINAGVMFALFFTLWLVSLLMKDASIIDIFWGLGFVVVAWTTALLAGWPAWRAVLVVTLTSLWGVRLSGYLGWRNWGEPEDRRYAEMRSHWGKYFGIVSLFTVFWLQATILLIVSVPLQTAIVSTSSIGWLDVLGGVLWWVGMFFEVVGDAQLARFKARPENDGEVLDEGLWRYTRHPNYFGEFVLWWGYYLVAASAGFGWTIFSPALMSFLLLKVSGVTLLEKSLVDRKPEYQAYIRRTNAFFPWWPKTG